MRIILFLLFFFFFTTCEAQKYIICTDYNNCTTGVKDSLGNWVVQPVYDFIREAYKGTYIVTQGTQLGVVNSSGKVLVPIIYSDVETEGWRSVYHSHSSNKSYLFIVATGNKKGVVDTTGKLIVPIQFSRVDINADTSILVYKKKNTWAFYSLSGEEFPVKGRPIYGPEFLGNHLYKIIGHSRHLKWWYGLSFSLERKCGVIDTKGKEVIPEKFEDVQFITDSFSVIRVDKGQHVGYFSTTGKTLIPMRLENPDDNSYQIGKKYYSVISRAGYLPLETTEKKWGILNLKGDTILPFDYDKMEYIQIPSDSNKYHSGFIVRKDSLYGFFSPEGKWLAPLQYQKLTLLFRFYFPTDTSQVMLFSAERNNKWGVISSNGDSILPFQYDTLCKVSKDEFVFIQGNSLTAITTPIPMYHEHLDVQLDKNSSSHSATNHFIVKQSPNGILWYHIPGTHVNETLNPQAIKDGPEIFVNDSSYKNSVLILLPVTNFTLLADSGLFYEIPNTYLYGWADHKPSQVYAKKNSATNKITLEAITNSSSENKNDYFFTSSGRVIVNRKIAFLPEQKITSITGRTSDDGKLYFYCMYNYKYGLLDSTGKIAVPFSSSKIKNFSSEYAWIEGENKDGFLYKYYNYQYNIYSIKENKIILDPPYYSQDTSEIASGFTSINTSKGVGLYNLSSKKFSIPPMYENLLRLDKAGKYYAVKTCSGNMGLVSSNGTMISDTGWIAINTCIFPDSTNQRKFKGYFDYVIFYNTNASFIFETASGNIVSRNSVRSLFLTSSLSYHSFSDYDKKGLIQYLQNNGRYSFNRNYTLWQENILFDSIFMPQRYMYSSSNLYNPDHCKYCREKFKGPHFDYAWVKDDQVPGKYFEITYLNDSIISVKRPGGFTDGYEQNIYFTVIYLPNGPQPLFLDSVLTGDWKNFVTNEVMNYVNSNLGVKGDCHNPASIPGLLNDHFNFTKEGLMLYPPGFKKDYDQVKILIPWEKLKPYLRKDIASKLELK